MSACTLENELDMLDNNIDALATIRREQFQKKSLIGKLISVAATLTTCAYNETVLRFVDHKKFLLWRFSIRKTKQVIR
jgi:hypothetical protein